MARKLVVEIVGDSSSLERSFKRSQKAAAGFDKNVKQAGRGALFGSGALGRLGRVATFASGAFLGTAGLTFAVKGAFTEMAEGQQVAAQTEAVLKSTGNVANVTAKQVDALASSLLNKSGVDDEVIKSGENVLLTFTNIRNETGKGNRIFERATRAALDMSVALGQDMQSSAIQLGKALNDPIRGVTALQRVGVSFTKAQKDQIKALVESGRTLDAQKLILAELTKEFGGSAEAAGKTLPGKLNILKESLSNLGGEIAEKLSPTIVALVDRLTKWIQNAQNQKRVIDAVTSAVKTMRDIINAIIPVVKTIAAVVKTMTDAVGGAKNATYLLIGAFVAFKALKMASAIGAVTGSLTSPTGLVAAAGLASFALTTMLLKATGLDNKLKTLGGTALGLTDKLGLTHDPGAQFKGKSHLGSDATDVTFILARLENLQRGGLSASASAERFAGTHPSVVRPDIDVLAGKAARNIVVHTTVNLDGKKVAHSTTKHQQRANHRNSTQKRGPFAGAKAT